MSDSRRRGPTELLRNFALSLERMATQEAASSAVQGAMDGLREELREELPGVDGQLRGLLQDTLTVLARFMREAAEREEREPGELARVLSAAAARGALAELEREWNNGGLPLHGFMQRLNTLLDGLGAMAHARDAEIRKPGDRANAMARGMVEGALAQAHQALPALGEDLRALAPVGAELASQVGQGLVEGMASRAQEGQAAARALLEDTARGLVRTLATGIEEELRARPGLSGEALGGTLARVAEDTAAATVRGAVRELVAQLRPLQQAAAGRGLLRHASREVAEGVLSALGARLRRPLAVAAGAGGAALTLALVTLRWRHA